MNPNRLEYRFRNYENEVCRDSFWFTYFAMTHIDDREKIRESYFNSENISTEKVIMYCGMWKKCEWN